LITNNSSDKKNNLDTPNKITQHFDRIHSNSNVDYTFKPNDMKQVLENHRYSDNSLSFD